MFLILALVPDKVLTANAELLATILWPVFFLIKASLKFKVVRSVWIKTNNLPANNSELKKQKITPMLKNKLKITFWVVVFFCCGSWSQIEDMEKTQRLQEIQAKLDPRAETRVRDGRVFKPVELLRRRLIHDGALLWKNAGSRLKGSLYFTLLLMDVHG